ncbi:MAG: hypothetical protein K0U54_02580, partial [Bacteroidetes bacterium]|nr:hypothetical protein [Bacteroidota bacterium]
VASFVMMFVTIPVADKILNGSDFFQNQIAPSVWGAITFGTLFVFFMGRWGYGWYKKITNSAGNLLKDLED